MKNKKKCDVNMLRYLLVFHHHIYDFEHNLYKKILGVLQLYLYCFNTLFDALFR